MFLCSICSIVAGGSLGPEAPIVAMCGAVVSFLSATVLRHQGRMLRYCTIMGMSAALAAFFGVALGGSVFALEVVHRLGLQYHEVAVYAVATGTMCLMVFRALSLSQFGAIWTFPETIPGVDSRHVVAALFMGALSAGFAMLFMLQHRVVAKLFGKLRLQEHRTPIASGAVGGLALGLLGAVLPPTMFWSEWETVSLADPRIPLPHIWPKGGFWGAAPFQQGNWGPLLLGGIALAKLPAISITVLSGFRGGFIFPLMFAGRFSNYDGRAWRTGSTGLHWLVFTVYFVLFMAVLRVTNKL